MGRQLWNVALIWVYLVIKQSFGDLKKFLKQHLVDIYILIFKNILQFLCDHITDWHQNDMSLTKSKKWLVEQIKRWKLKADYICHFASCWLLIFFCHRHLQNNCVLHILQLIKCQLIFLYMTQFYLTCSRLRGGLKESDRREKYLSPCPKAIWILYKQNFNCFQMAKINVYHPCSNIFMSYLSFINIVWL